MFSTTFETDVELENGEFLLVNIEAISEIDKNDTVDNVKINSIYSPQKGRNILPKELSVKQFQKLIQSAEFHSIERFMEEYDGLYRYPNNDRNDSFVDETTSDEEDYDIK